MNRKWLIAFVLGWCIYSGASDWETLLRKLPQGKSFPEPGISLFTDGRRLTVDAEGAGREYRVMLSLLPTVKWVWLDTQIRVTNVTPGSALWQDARLEVRFFSQGKMMKVWPNLFHFSGTAGPVSCRRAYPVPAGADACRLTFANYGKTGKAEFMDTKVEFWENDNRLDKDALAPDGRTDSERWALKDAQWRRTATREEVCLNGLWKFRPLLPKETMSAAPPAGSGWGFFKVPGVWPKWFHSECPQRFYMSEQMERQFSPSTLERAWYRRSIAIPPHWGGRKIGLYTDLIQCGARVFLDGQDLGSWTYPGGFFDLTGHVVAGRTHELTILVSALPNDSVVYMGDDRLLTSRKLPKNRGLVGDVFLRAFPRDAAVDDLYIRTSFRQKNTIFDTALRLPDCGSYYLEVTIEDGAQIVATYRSPSINGRPGVPFRYAFKTDWRAPKLWDTDTPDNLYTAKMRLLDSSGKVLDEFFPQPFGFREFYTVGRDFYLNGKKIHLRTVLGGHVQLAGTTSSEVMEHTCRLVKEYGGNFMFGWNYNFSPGVFQYFSPFHETSSRHGILTALTLPHINEFQFRLDRPEIAERYRKYCEHLIRRYQNVPGVVLLVMNHNATGYLGDQNPERIGSAYRPENVLPPGAQRNREQAVIAEKIAKSIDPERPVYHHESGHLGDVYAINCYLNWAPRQERSDWLADWEKNGCMPVFFVEWGLPHNPSWSSWRGPAFIWNSRGLQCIWLDEFNAAILGEAAYRQTPVKARLQERQCKLIKGNRPRFFGEIIADELNQTEDIQRVRAYYASRNIRDLRLRGISGLLPWDQPFFWDRKASAKMRENPHRFEQLKRPGIVLDWLIDTGEAVLNPYGTFELNLGGRSVRDAFQPMLGAIAGKIGDFTESSGNFAPGETVQKSLQFLNDSRQNATVQIQWQVSELNRKGKIELSAAAGMRAEAPLEIQIPNDFSGTSLTLQASFRFPEKTTTDELKLNVVPPRKIVCPREIALFDPEGTAKELLERIGVPFRDISGPRELNGREILVIGRNALPKFQWVLKPLWSKGLKVLVLEQSFSTLERLGLRPVSYGFRTVFPVESTGFGRIFRDWRGASSSRPPYREVPVYEFQMPSEDWQGFRNQRVWTAGNRGIVTSVPIEKPQVGNWLPYFQTGFDLQYAPLLRFCEGDTEIWFSQFDCCGRSEFDPAMANFLSELLVRIAEAPKLKYKSTFYVGNATGRKLLDSLHVTYQNGLPNSWTGAEVLIVGPDADLPDMQKTIQNGLTVVTFGSENGTLRKFGVRNLPKRRKCHPAYVENLANMPILAGVSNADLYWREPMELAAFAPKSDGGQTVGMEQHGKGRIVMIQLTPWMLDAKEFYLRTSRRRNTFLISRILGNLQVPFDSGFEAQLKAMRGEGADWTLPDCWIGRKDAADQGVKAGYFRPEYRPDSQWRAVMVPGCFDLQFSDTVGYDGVFWYRVTFRLPPELAASSKVTLDMGRIDDESQVWLNGNFLGEVSAKTHPDNYWQINRIYPLAPGLLNAGENQLVVRVNDLRGNGGILGKPTLRVPRFKSFYTDEPIASDDPYRYYKW